MAVSPVHACVSVSVCVCLWWVLCAGITGGEGAAWREAIRPRLLVPIHSVLMYILRVLSRGKGAGVLGLNESNHRVTDGV